MIVDNDVKTVYTVDVKNRFHALQHLAIDDSFNTMYENIIKANQKSAELHVPLKPKAKRRVPWENEEICRKRLLLKNAHQRIHENLTPEDIKTLEIAKNNLDGAYLNEQETYINEKVQQLEHAHANRKRRLAWFMVNEISGRKTAKSGQIKAKSSEDQIKLWKEHFINLLGQPPVIDDQPIEKNV